MALSVNRLIRVSLTINPRAAASRGFGTLLILGDSDAIPAYERFRMYTNINDVAQDLGIDSEEYKAASLFYSQEPAPINLMIGRWIRSPEPAILIGGKLDAAAQSISTWKSITNGTLGYTVNGEHRAVTGLDFHEKNTLAEVAETVTAAMRDAALTYEDDSFLLQTLATGSQQSLGYVYALPKQTSVETILALTQDAGAKSVDGTAPEEATAGTLTSGAIDLLAVKAVGDGCFTISVDSRSQSLTGLDFRAVQDMNGLATMLSEKITGATVRAEGNTLIITSETTGLSSKVGYATAGAVTKQDISAMLKLTESFAYEPHKGLDVETPTAAVRYMCDLTADWYGVTFAAKNMPTDEELLDVAKFVENQQETTRVFGITTKDVRVLDHSFKQDIASKCKEAKLNRTVVQYSRNPYAICSFFGRAFTVNFNGNLTTITMMYKQEPEVIPETLTETEAHALAEKNCNVFVKYNNNTAIIQNGVMSGDYWWDERHGSDWLKEYVQNNLWNFVYSSRSKVGQDDAGMNNVVSVINDSLTQAKNNGFIGAGVWNNEGFGQLERGQYMPDGFYVYTPPMATQTQADRDTRISTPIQVAAKLLGAIHTFDVAITLNR